MVSLRNNDRGGGAFLGDSSIEESDTQPVLGIDLPRKFKPLNTIYTAFLQLVAGVGIVVTAIVMGQSWPKDREQCEPYFILLYLHAVFWFISFVIHHHLTLSHEKLRLNGYLQFYKLTGCHIKVPIHLVSMWNAVVLIVGSLIHQLDDTFKEKCNKTGFFTPLNFLTVLIAVEVFALSPFLMSYIAKVRKFNKLKHGPDVLQEEMMTNFNVNHFDAGFGEHSVQDLLEKQSDLIQFLKHHNMALCRKIVELNTQIHGER